MNFTHVEHAIYAMLIQGVFMLVFRAVSLPSGAVVGGAFAAGFFISREHAQREYKIGDPSRLMPWEGFDVWNWSTDAQLDVVFPVVAVVAVAIVARRVARKKSRHQAGTGP